jgi:tripartite-type tricarboxylate transporter receptor subunit TctC
MTTNRVKALRLTVIATIVALLSLAPPFASAQTHFYQGKTITLVQSSDAGDTSDTMVRAALPTLKKHIPGEPAIKLQFMPGGDGTKAANQRCSPP